MPGAWLAQILDEWRAFDFQAFQDRLDGLSQYIAQFGEQSIHLVRIDGKGPNPLPLLLTHGWPGSFLEHLKLTPLLTDPATHGGDAADAFTLIIPSLPGYGFKPYAYSWSGDDPTSVFTCAGGCSYRIVFGVTQPAIGGPPG